MRIIVLDAKDGGHNLGCYLNEQKYIVNLKEFLEKLKVEDYKNTLFFIHTGDDFWSHNDFNGNNENQFETNLEYFIQKLSVSTTRVIFFSGGGRPENLDLNNFKDSFIEKKHWLFLIPEEIEDKYYWDRISEKEINADFNLDSEILSHKDVLFNFLVLLESYLVINNRNVKEYLKKHNRINSNLDILNESVNKIEDERVFRPYKIKAKRDDNIPQNKQDEGWFLFDNILNVVEKYSIKELAEKLPDIKGKSNFKELWNILRGYSLNKSDGSQKIDLEEIEILNLIENSYNELNSIFYEDKKKRI